MVDKGPEEVAMWYPSAVGDRSIKRGAAAEFGNPIASHTERGTFRHPTLDGMRPTALADEMQISKQAVNDLLGDLERRGYIRRDVDPGDKRSRLIRLTAKG